MYILNGDVEGALSLLEVRAEGASEAARAGTPGPLPTWEETGGVLHQTCATQSGLVSGAEAPAR